METEEVKKKTQALVNEQNHIINNIKSSKLIYEPFTHKLVNNIFSNDYYQNLLKFLPDKDKYVSILKTGRVTSNYSPERFLFKFTEENLNKLSKKQRDFFKNLIKMLVSRKIFNSVTEIFENVIRNRIKNFTKREIELCGTDYSNVLIEWPMLVKDYTKYHLGAHTDTERKIISFLFYLPKNDELKNVGTALYKPKEQIEVKKIYEHFGAQDTKKKFIKAKTCHFLPNSVLIFPKTLNTWHGVEEVNIKQQERDLLVMNYWFIKNGN